MAAIDLPINDSYLSHIHHIRNANKAALRAEVAAANAAAKASANEVVFEVFDPSAMASVSSSAGTNGGQTVATGLRASDSAVLAHYPTPLLRFLALLSPVVRIAVRFVHLATWTGGPGTASHSFILVLAWWTICLYGYEAIRYCPQLALLGVLTVTGLLRAFRSSQGRVPAIVADKEHQPAVLASAESLNATIDGIAVLADFISTLYAHLLAPVAALFCWHDTTQTFGLAVFLITSWPVWLLLFSGTLAHVWDVLGLTYISQSLYFQSVRLVSTIAPHARAHLASLASVAQAKAPSLFARASQLHAPIARARSFSDSHVLPRVLALITLLSHRAAPLVLQTAPGPHVGVFPILALRVRHLLLVLGTVALTWCSPWCALIRHALWRSALVRRSTRLTWACLSGQIIFSHGSTSPYVGAGRLTLGPNGEPISLGRGDALGAAKASAAVAGSNDIDATAANTTRHEDVVYQFTIFENQRWWMGLDWTAALLPQERPSWADESNSPVSPPSSFSLPPPKTTLKHTPTSSDRNRYTKRFVRWQWIDPEWTVAGREAPGEPQVISSSAKTAFAAGLRRASTTSAASVTSATSDVTSASAARVTSDLSVDPSWLDVDAEGWQYGDNSWDKMSKKAGMGRYTRRRRWIRRAVLVELVQTDYHATPSEVAELEGGADNLKPPFWSSSTDADGTTGSVDSILAAPASPTTEANLRDRLARAAAGGANVGTAGNTEATQPPSSPRTAESAPEKA